MSSAIRWITRNMRAIDTPLSAATEKGTRWHVTSSGTDASPGLSQPGKSGKL